MSMMVGAAASNKSVTKISYRNTDGAKGTITITKSLPKKRKRLNYNMRRISSKILKSKTSNSANQAAVSARNVVSALQRKLSTGDYDDQEVQRALVHARKMVRVAKKRMKHMREEELAARKGSCIVYNESEETTDIPKQNRESDEEFSAEEMEELMRELEQLTKENLDASLEESLREMADELMGTVQQDMDPDELERLKKKHRASELQDIVRADMEYLKALFDKLAKEKQAAISGSAGSSSTGQSNDCTGGQSAPTGLSNGVSLQLLGADIPVDMPDAVEVIEGGNMDISV